MTRVYFVRHAQPVHSWEDDSTRPLTDEGIRDSKQVTELLKNIHINCLLSSPYKRSMETIRGLSNLLNMDILTDERFKERQKGPGGNQYGMFRKRWADFNFCEDGGESLSSVQERNINALKEVLSEHTDEGIVIATHGTALSTILNYYIPEFACDDFLRIIDYMPYVIRLDFNGSYYIGKDEMLIVEKEFKGKERADKA